MLDEVERTGALLVPPLLRPPGTPAAAGARPAAASRWRRRGSRCRSEAAELRGDIVAAVDVRVELVADRRRPLVLRAGQPTTAAAAPVVAGHRGAVLPGVPAGRVLAIRCGPRTRRAGRRRCSRCVDGRDGVSSRSAPRPRSRTTRAACTSAPTPTRWGCSSARRWRPCGCRGGPGSGPGSWARERGRAVRRFEAGVTDVLGVLALLGVVAAFVWVDEFSARCTAAASWRSRCSRRCSSARSRTRPGCWGVRSAASRGAGSVSGPTASTCGTGPCSCSAVPGSTSRPVPVARHDPAPRRRARARRAVLPVRRAARPPRGGGPGGRARAPAARRTAARTMLRGRRRDHRSRGRRGGRDGRPRAGAPARARDGGTWQPGAPARGDVAAADPDPDHPTPDARTVRDDAAAGRHRTPPPPPPDEVGGVSGIRGLGDARRRRGPRPPAGHRRRRRRVPAVRRHGRPRARAGGRGRDARAHRDRARRHQRADRRGEPAGRCSTTPATGASTWSTCTSRAPGRTTTTSSSPASPPSTRTCTCSTGTTLGHREPAVALHRRHPPAARRRTRGVRRLARGVDPALTDQSRWISTTARSSSSPARTPARTCAPRRRDRARAPGPRRP